MAEMFKFVTAVTFPAENQARMVFEALSVDPELRPDDVSRDMAVSECQLQVTFAAKEVRLLRAAVGTFCDLMSLAIRTLEAFEDSIQS